MGEALRLFARHLEAHRRLQLGGDSSGGVPDSTSFRLSTIYLASAVRDNGGGAVIARELQTDKGAAAQSNFDDAGLST